MSRALSMLMLGATLGALWVVVSTSSHDLEFFRAPPLVTQAEAAPAARANQTAVPAAPDAPAAPVKKTQGTGRASPPFVKLTPKIMLPPPEKLASAAQQGESVSGPEGSLFEAGTKAITFQGLLTDGSGIPVPGPTVNLEFNIYDTGGTVVVGPITLNGVPISNGIVNVQIPVDPDIYPEAFDGHVRKLGVKVNGGVELLPRLTLTSVPYAFRTNFVGNEELVDHLVLGDAATSAEGSLKVENESGGPGGIGLQGDWAWWDPAVELPQVYLANESAELIVQIYDNGSAGGVPGMGPGGVLRVAGPGGTLFDPGIDVLSSAANGGGEIRGYNSTGAQTVDVTADAGAGGAAMYLSNGSAYTVSIIAKGGGDDGQIHLRVNNEPTAIALMASSRMISTYSSNGDEKVRLWGDQWGSVFFWDQAHERTVLLSASQDSGGELFLYDHLGAQLGVFLDGDSGGTGGLLRLYDSSGAATITLDGEVSGKGRVTTQVLEITGGADLSEQFNVRAEATPRSESTPKQPRAQRTPASGMVVCIAPEHPGELIVSSKAYDRTVAGVISGAGGVESGMLMRQSGSRADGQHPVALTGRVYCLADASYGAIRPGDLLTTSDTPGHAMKVTDHARAQGAILGKAMSSLEAARGLVLILVTLQ